LITPLDDADANGTLIESSMTAIARLEVAFFAVELNILTQPTKAEIPLRGGTEG
jgi:hypothetical protein